MKLNGLLAGAFALPAFSSWMCAADECAAEGAARAAAALLAGATIPTPRRRWSWDGCCISTGASRRTRAVAARPATIPQFAFTDGAAVSTGIKSQKGGRSAPTVINRAYSLAQFWDGRAARWKSRPRGRWPTRSKWAMTHDAARGPLKGSRATAPLFAKAFGTEEIDIDRVAMAIASFERTVLSGNAPYDRYKRGDKKAMTAGAGARHDGVLRQGEVRQVPRRRELHAEHVRQPGRRHRTSRTPTWGGSRSRKNPRDWGVFKTPTLREIEHTAPYMHDGSLKTLEEVVEFYNKGGIQTRTWTPTSSSCI